MISIIQKEPEFCIELKGELTIFQAQALFSALKELQLEQASLTIDMKHVSQIDSSALQILLVFQRFLKKQDKKLTLVNHSDQVLNVLMMLGLSGCFNDPVVEASAKCS